MGYEIIASMNNARSRCEYDATNLFGGIPNDLEENLTINITKDVSPISNKVHEIHNVRLGSTYFLRMRVYWKSPDGSKRILSTCPSKWSDPIHIPCPDYATCVDEEIR